jgi:hypothetical protein
LVDNVVRVPFESLVDVFVGRCRMNRVMAVSLAALSLSGLVAGCGAEQRSVEPVAPVRYSLVRPGDLLDQFTGASISAATAAKIRAAALLASKSCPGSSTQPFEPPKLSTAHLLQQSDLGAFRERYGYGVVQDQVDAAIAQAAGNAASTGSTVPAPTAESAECERRITDAMNQFAPPVGLVQRADEIQFAAMSRADVAATIGRWQACMARAGFPTTEQPRSARVIVETMVEREKERLGPTTQPNAGDGFQGFVALPAEVITSLQATELQVFAADTGCLETSGAGSALLSVEAETLSQLKVEFPGFSGVS